MKLFGMHTMKLRNAEMLPIDSFASNETAHAAGMRRDNTRYISQC
jgi:hypothetical protein